MVPGFNTDFKYRGETYHVQTEDNGAANPVVVTLLYHKGAILASRKTSYRDLLGKAGFEQELMVLMKAQHKDLMRALLAGSFDQNGVAPAAGGSGEDPAAAAQSVVASAAPASGPAAAPAPSRPGPRVIPPPVHPPRVASPAPRPAAAPRPVTASLDEAIRDYLQTYAAATVAH